MMGLMGLSNSWCPGDCNLEQDQSPGCDDFISSPHPGQPGPSMGYGTPIDPQLEPWLPTGWEEGTRGLARPPGFPAGNWAPLSSHHLVQSLPQTQVIIRSGVCAGSSLLPQNLMADFSGNLRCPLSPYPEIPLVIDRGPGRWAAAARFHRPVLTTGPHGQPWPLTDCENKGN